MDPILEIDNVQIDIMEYLDRNGNVFKIFDKQDSGCISVGFENNEGKKLIKYSTTVKCMQSLKNSIKIHSKFTHRLLIPLINSFKFPSGIALVYPWVEGHNLFDYTQSAKRDETPGSIWHKFRNQKIEVRIQIINQLMDFFQNLEREGIIAVDFYDGCFLYNFDTVKLRIFDIDEFQLSPFILEDERLPGSSRFMAPEEFVKGSLIDHATNVYLVGKILDEFLTNAKDFSSFEYRNEILDLITQSTYHDKNLRIQSINELSLKWQIVQKKILTSYS